MFNETVLMSDSRCYTVFKMALAKANPARFGGTRGSRGSFRGFPRYFTLSRERRGRPSTAAVGFGPPGLAVLAFASTIREKQRLSEEPIDAQERSILPFQ